LASTYKQQQQQQQQQQKTSIQHYIYILKKRSHSQTNIGQTCGQTVRNKEEGEETKEIAN